MIRTSPTRASPAVGLSATSARVFVSRSLRLVRRLLRRATGLASASKALFVASALATVALSTTATSSYAQEYQWQLIDPVPQPTCPNYPDPDCYWYGQGPLSNPTQQLQPTFLIKSIVTSFDSDTKRWVFEAIMGDNPAFSGTVVPDSFWMVLNHGPMPGGPGQASMVYVDATEIAAPKLTVYAYNGTHALFDRSWIDGSNAGGTQAPDLVCTSLNAAPCGSWVNSLSAEDLPNGDRKFFFDVDASPILNHTPLYGPIPTLWHRPSAGAEPRIFDAGIGIWFHVGLGRQFSYNSDGFISGVCEADYAGYYDADWLTTNRRPECTTDITLTHIRPGELSTFTITGTDVGATTPPVPTISGDLPPIACTPQSVGNDTTEVSCSLVGPFVSTPTVYQASVTFADDGGLEATCQAAITVVNTAPTCSLTVNAQDPEQIACEGVATTVALSVSTSDQDMDPIIQTPTIVCSSGDASVESQNPSLLVASTTGPGLGEQTNCTVTLEVSDGFASNSCQASFSVNPCELDCLNNPNGTAQIDMCGVCNGNNACVDCAGTPFGTASLDRCNVCDGDGQSCLDCADVNNTGSQSALDGAALSLKGLVKSGTGQIRTVEGDTKRTRRFTRKVNVAANEAYQRAWTAIWSVPTVGAQCTNEFCVTVSSEQGVIDYDAAIADLNQILTSVTKRLGKAGARRKKRRLEKRQEATNQTVEVERSTIVTSLSSC